MPNTADDFYKAELARLTAKNTQVSQLSNSQQRLTLMNESYRKRYAKYVQMLMVLVLAYLAYLGMTLLQKSFPIIPVVVLDYFLVILIFLVVYYLFFAFSTLTTRNNTNYDELDIPALNDGSGVDANAILEAGKLTPSTLVSEICVGNKCCPIGFHWDQSANECVSDCSSAYPLYNTATSQCENSAGTVQPAAFTTLEYSYLERQSETRFDDPSLKRSPDGGNIQTTFVETDLQFSPIELSRALQ